MSTIREHNALFVKRLGEAGGIEKVAEASGEYLRDKLREQGFTGKIMPREQITPAECERSTHHDTLVKILDVEPDSVAMSISFRGQPRAQYIQSGRWAISFISISSYIFEKVEQELLAYEMPITKVLEDHIGKDIQAVEDRLFLVYCEQAIQALQTETNTNVAVAYNATNIRALAASTTAVSVIKGEGALSADGVDFAIHPLQKPDLVNLVKLLDGNELRSECFLIHEVDYDDILQWTLIDIGDQITGETTIEGYKYETLLGKRLVRTIKKNVLRAGNIYVFTSPEALGRFYTLNPLKFYIDKKANRITFQAWEDVGLGVGNISAVRKLELYRGSVRPTAQDVGFAARIPREEEDLGGVNNRVSAGLVYPTVVMY